MLNVDRSGNINCPFVLALYCPPRIVEQHLESVCMYVSKPKEYLVLRISYLNNESYLVLLSFRLQALIVGGTSTHIIEYSRRCRVCIHIVQSETKRDVIVSARHQQFYVGSRKSYCSEKLCMFILAACLVIGHTLVGGVTNCTRVYYKLLVHYIYSIVAWFHY